MSKVITREIDLKGKKLVLETGSLAKQADGAVLVKYGNTSVLCIVVAEKKDSTAVDFLPLSVNYVEKYYAGGKIPGGFFKREGKQSESEILISRLIDRPLRPTFVDGYYRNTQVICMLLSYDKNYESDIAAMIGASAAVGIAGLPTIGAIAGSRVGYIDNQYVLNPSKAELKDSKMDLVVAGTDKAILMVESEINELPEDIVLGAVNFGQSQNEYIVNEINQFVKDVDNGKKVDFVSRDRKCLLDKISDFAKNQLIDAFAIKDKSTRKAAIEKIFSEVKEKLTPCNNNQECSNITESVPLVTQNGVAVDLAETDIKLAFDKLQEIVLRDKILNQRLRIDGRKLDEIRNISIDVDYLPVVHGSAIFTRGSTQVMSVVTLGNSFDEQQADSLSANESAERFMLHYNFHGFSAGDVTGPKAPGRREVGHGRLAYRALKPIIPSKAQFPYTTRIVAEVLESDGSTSMATVCSGCLALMATGVPIVSPVAGIAMGLIKEDNNYAILTDIMADEDHLGDMDFKVTGTANGITALQMDIKIDGITNNIMQEALDAAKKARLHILSKMQEAMPAARTSVNNNAPKIFNLNISTSQIPELIGKSGAVIKSICEKSASKVEVSNEGLVTVFAPNEESLDIAKNMISAIIDPIEEGTIFDATVKSIMPFGVLVDIGYNRAGLVHISEISNEKINDIFAYPIKEGEPIKVRYLGTDEKNRLKFSIRAVDAVNDDNDNENNEQIIKDSGSFGNVGGNSYSGGKRYHNERPHRGGDRNNFNKDKYGSSKHHHSRDNKKRYDERGDKETGGYNDRFNKHKNKESIGSKIINFFTKKKKDTNKIDYSFFDNGKRKKKRRMF